MRHLFGTGLSQQQVEETLAEAARLVACGGNVAGWFGGLVQIEGHSIVYEAFLVTAGVINVGTCFPKP
jgi:hypothetical protein